MADNHSITEITDSNKWTSKKLFITIVFSAATFAASFIIGNAITLAFGPGTSGIATIIITTILVVICARIVETKGVFTLLVFIFTVLAIPTNMFGPPNPLKIFIGLLTGIVYDLIWNLTGRKKYSLPIAATISTMVSILLIYLLLNYLNHPRKEYLQSILLWLIPVYGILGYIGGIAGDRIYQKSLKRLSIIKQLKA